MLFVLLQLDFRRSSAVGRSIDLSALLDSAHCTCKMQAYVMSKSETFLCISAARYLKSSSPPHRVQAIGGKRRIGPCYHSAVSRSAQRLIFSQFLHTIRRRSMLTCHILLQNIILFYYSIHKPPASIVQNEHLPLLCRQQCNG